MRPVRRRRFGKKQAELLEREARLQEQIEACGQDRAKNVDVAAEAEFDEQTLDLFDTIRADSDEFRERARQMANRDQTATIERLEILCLNFSLDVVSLVPTTRKPFDMIAEGLVWKNSRGERI